MAGQVFNLFAYGFAKPCLHFRTVHIIVVNPAFIAGIVRRIDVYALNLAGIIWQKSFESQKVIGLHQKIAAVWVAAGKIFTFFEKVERDLAMMINYGFFSYPVQCWHCVTLLC
jgi:hypothetical protein